ncbi:MAG: hypothetical protein ACRDRW_18990 [Pseudonocardiaceae bacterium]
MLVVHCDSIDTVPRSAAEALLVSGSEADDDSGMARLELPAFVAAIELSLPVRPNTALARCLAGWSPPVWEAAPGLAGQDGRSRALVVHTGDTPARPSLLMIEDRSPHIDAIAFVMHSRAPDQLAENLMSACHVIGAELPEARHVSLSLIVARIHLRIGDIEATVSWLEE